MRSLLTVIIFSAVLISSCSLMRSKPQADITKTSYRELLQRTTAWQKSMKTLTGGTRITMDSPNFSGKFDARIVMGGEDSLLITVTGPFGLPVGKVFFSKNRFLFYNQLMNQFYTGSRQDFKGRNFLQFPVEIGQIRSVFIAQDKFDVLKMETFEVRNNAYYLHAVNGKLSYNIWFDPEYLLIRKIEYLDNDQLLYYKEYSDYRKVNGTYFPHVINFMRPEFNEGLSIFFTSLALNQPLERDIFNIKVSDTAEQIDLSIQNN